MMFRKWLAEKLYPECIAFKEGKIINASDVMHISPTDWQKLNNHFEIIVFPDDNYRNVRNEAFQDGYNAHKKEIADSLKPKGIKIEFSDKAEVYSIGKNGLQLHKAIKPKRKYTKKAKNV